MSTGHNTLDMMLDEVRGTPLISSGPLIDMVDQLQRRADAQLSAEHRAALTSVRADLIRTMHTARDIDRWISVEHAARLTGRPLTTIRRWCSREQVVAKKLGGEWVIDRDSLYRNGSEAA
jgi:hypothetical protein